MVREGCRGGGVVSSPPGLLASIFHPETVHVHRSSPEGDRGQQTQPRIRGLSQEETHGSSRVGVPRAAADGAPTPRAPPPGPAGLPGLDISDHRLGRQVLQRQPRPVLRSPPQFHLSAGQSLRFSTRLAVRWVGVRPPSARGTCPRSQAWEHSRSLQPPAPTARPPCRRDSALCPQKHF